MLPLVLSVVLAGSEPELSQRIAKTYGLSAEATTATRALQNRGASTAAQRLAEPYLVNGGVYSLGALSLLVNGGAEEDVLLVLTGAPGLLRDERTAAATRLFGEVLARFPELQKKALTSDLPRDRLIAFAAVRTAPGR
jgi:hypothetical protein